MARDNRNNKKKIFVRRGGMNHTSKVSSRRPNPPPVPLDVKTSQRFEFYVTWSSPTFGQVGNISPAQIQSALPGTNLWNFFQIQRLDVYGAEEPRYNGGGGDGLTSWPDVSVTLNSNIYDKYLGDAPTFTSDAVSNSRRAHVGITPNELFRNAWINSNDTNSLIQVYTAANGSHSTSGNYSFSVLVQLSLNLRSTAGSGNIPGLKRTIVASTNPICDNSSDLLASTTADCQKSAGSQAALFYSSSPEVDLLFSKL